ncbi:MAG: DUF58 domain-containing protein [Actinomycetaceae bacterium]|nr:DUF58 domain-containing protein [Actinomycetaceae bacterium]
MSPTPSSERPSRFHLVRGRMARALGWVTGSGWALIALLVLSLVLARFAAWVEAFFIAIVAALVLVIALIWVLIPSPHAVGVRLPRARVVAGRTAIGEVEVTNTRSTGASAGVVELPVGQNALNLLVPALGARGRWSELFTVVTRRRGVLQIGPARSVRSDPLGLLRRVREFSQPDVLYVHPKTLRIPFDVTGMLADIEGVATSRLSSSDVAFHALRDYVPGDPRRNVHWASSARTGRMIVRVFEETRRSHHLIIIDTSESVWSGDDLEIAVSIVGSLAISGIENNRRLSVATSHEYLSTSSSSHLLDGLAALATGPDSDLLRRVEVMCAAHPDITALTVVVPSATPISSVGRIATLAGPDCATSVIRIAPGADARRRHLGQALLLECPDLESLGILVLAGSGGPQ